MSRDDQTFEPRVGKPRDQGRRSLRRPASFTRQVMLKVYRERAGLRQRDRMKTAKPNGRFNARGRGAKVARSLSRDHGWSFDARTGLRTRDRRVIVKARVVKLWGSDSRASYAHIRYLQRDGVTRDGSPGRLYSAWSDDENGAKFQERSQDDRHQFRLIVAPEDAADLPDVHKFTRQLMTQMEFDLETHLDWIAVDHHNTGHPHTHVVIRGVTDEGKILNIAGDYIAHGIRHRASEIMTLTLGRQSELEVQQKLSHEVDQERFTRLDRALLAQVNDEGLIDSRPLVNQSTLHQADRYLLLRRLKHLEQMGLAREEEPGLWSVSERMERTLRELGERGDIIKEMHRALTEQGIERLASEYALHGRGTPTRQVTGRLVAKGVGADELTNRQSLIVDGIDGHVHYVEIAGSADEAKIGNIIEVARKVERSPADRNIAAVANANGGFYRPAQHLEIARTTVRVPGGNYEEYVRSHVRRLHALARAGVIQNSFGPDEWTIPLDFERRALAYDTEQVRREPVRILSAYSLERQITAEGATMLDRTLVRGVEPNVAYTGFGVEVRDALAKRQQWLVDQGLAQRDGETVLYNRRLLQILERRELAKTGKAFEQGMPVPFRMTEEGQHVHGTYRKSVQLASGKFAVIENGLEFTLVPWRPILERERGRSVGGIMRGDGVSWDIGRKRQLGLGR